MGLVRALGKLDGPEIYYLIVDNQEQLEWLEPHLGPNQRIIDKRRWREDQLTKKRLQTKPLRAFVNRLLGPVFDLVRSVQSRLEPDRFRWPEVQLSDGFFESLGCDVLHFPSQRFILAAVPSIYTPHDLQHLHYPQFFTPLELARRETVYPAGCHFAHTVIAGTQWIKDDISRQYSVNPDKIQVIPWASPTLAYSEPTPADLQAVRDKYRLESPFALYPAAAWPHKNHIRLLEAIAYLRDTKGITIRLVCTGSIANHYWVHHWPKIEKRMQELSLGDQVKFLGFIEEKDMRPIYRQAQFLVIPSLFEADSCPIHEAWIEGVPVTCSNVTALPDQVQNAGLLFDPGDVQDIARALSRMALEGDLRARLIQCGYQRTKDFDWDRTARAYRAVYRRAAGCRLTKEDSILLSWDWLRDPRRKPEQVTS
jgi:glycosyltransferase involved in cell wall biosynthesis